MTGPATKAALQKLILSAFQNFSPKAKESTIQAIEQSCKIKIEDLDSTNYEGFLNAMEQELLKVNEPWKASFVTRVVRQLLEKRLRDG